MVRAANGRLLPGNPGGGRPLGSRQKLAEQFIRDAYELWKVEGPAALLQLRREDNAKFVQVMVGLIPRDLVLTVEADESPFAQLSPDEKRKLAAQIMETIRSDQAKIVDGNVDSSVDSAELSAKAE